MSAIDPTPDTSSSDCAQTRNVFDTSGYYTFTLWTNNKYKPLFTVWNSVSPDLFRQCFTTKVDKSGQGAFDCPFTVDSDEYIDYNFYTGTKVYSPKIIDDNTIKAFLYFGYSAPSLKYVESIDGDTIYLKNSEVLKFNRITKVSNNNSMTTKQTEDYLDNHQLMFLQYFRIRYPPVTLLYQLINFYLKSENTHDYLLSNKRYICNTELYWEYTLICNERTRRSFKIDISELSLSALYIQFKNYLGNGSCNRFNCEFFRILSLAINVFTDVQLDFLQTRNAMRMPLYNKNNYICTKRCKKNYMSNYYKRRTRELYNKYITNKSELLVSEVLDLNKNIQFDADSFLLNIVFIKVETHVNVLDKRNFIRNNYLDSDVIYNFTDNPFNIDEFYFMNSGDTFALNLSRLKNVLCWTYSEKLFTDFKDLLGHLHFDKHINILVDTNFYIYIFYT